MRTGWLLGILSGVGLATALDLSQASLHGGLKLGYSLGQDGMPWPNLLKSALSNNNRGGFGLDLARLRGEIPVDSSLKIVGQVNLAYWDLSDIYVEKQWGAYRWTLGKFAGAGPRTGPGTDELDQITVRTPFYTRYWSSYDRRFGWRDFGIQVERKYFDGRFTHRLFLHNSNFQNVYNDEPNWYSTPPTQALGITYGWEFKTTDHSLLGGHLGARADKEWDEFIGRHDFWEAGYWFKTNPVVSGSLFHEFDVDKLWVQSEFLALLDRDRLTPQDSTATKTWGLSVLGRYNLNARWNPYARYEFIVADDINPNDVFHILAVGTRYNLQVQSKRPWFWTFQYTRILESGFKNTVSDDAVYAQLQAEF